MIVVIFVLPSMFMVFDKVIVKTSKGFFAITLEPRGREKWLFYCPRWHPVIKYTKPECKGRKDKYIVMIMQTCYNMTLNWFANLPSIKKLGKVHNMYDYFLFMGVL